MPHIDPVILDGVLEHLTERAPSEAVKTKLRNLHEVCKALVLSGVGPTVPAVVKKYETLYKAPGQSMAEASIRNKRGDANLFNQLYRAWADYAKANVKSRRRVGELIAPDELSSIPDTGLRHRVSLTMADNHSLRSRLNILETVNEERSIRIEGFTPPTGMQRQSASMTAPDPDDIDALRDFLDPRKLKARGLVMRADRAVVTERGQLIADPGFLDALERVAKRKG